MKNSRWLRSIRFSFSAAFLMVMLTPAMTLGGKYNTYEQNVSSRSSLPFFNNQVCFDQVLGMDAFSILVPENWSVAGEVIWVPEGSISNPAVFYCSTEDPYSLDAVNIYPMSNMVWFGPQSSMGMLYPEGSTLNGGIVCQPVGAVDYILGYYMPLLQQNFGRINVTGSTQLPDLADAAYNEAEYLIFGQGAGYQMEADAAKVRFSYEMGREAVEEDVVVAILYLYDPYNQLGIWSIRSYSSCRSALGNLDSREELLGTILASFRIMPAWQAAIEDFRNALLQQQAAYVPANIDPSQYVGSASSYSGIYTNEWEVRSDSYDRIASSYSDAILGVETFYDSDYGYEVELPSGYSSYYSNGNGSYYFSDDVNFDPNVDLEYSGSDWSLLD